MHSRLIWVRALLGKAAVQLAGLAALASAAALLVGLNGETGLLAVVSGPEARRGVTALLGRLAAVRGGSMGEAAEADLVASAVGGEEALLGGMDDEGGAGGSIGSIGSTGSAVVLDLSPVFLFVGQYYGWWACLVWSVVACSTMLVYRLGLNSD